MPMNERVIISLTILITGFVVVFSVLLLLIGLIKLYGTIVSKALESAENKKRSRWIKCMSLQKYDNNR